MKESKKIQLIFLRYIAIFILGLEGLYLIYKVLTPITIHVIAAILGLFKPTFLSGDMISFGASTIQIVPACVAGAAFYLLLLLLLTTADVKPKTRMHAILVAIAMLFTLNIARMLVLASLIGSPNFETIHWVFWHVVSTVFVVGTYIATVRMYKIKSIPIYSDFKYLLKVVKKSYS